MVVYQKKFSQPARTNLAYQDFDCYVFKYMQREKMGDRQKELRVCTPLGL